MPVDFVKSDGGKNQPKRSGYDIEYTNPNDQPVEAKPQRGNLLSWFSKPKTPSYAAVPQPKVLAPQGAEAKSAAAPSAQMKGKTSYQPVTQATVASPVQSAVPVQSKSGAPLGVLASRQLPPAPLPPMHAAPAPVRPAIIPVIAPVAVPVKTVTPKPTMPVAPTPIAPTPVMSAVKPQPVKPQLPVPPLISTAPVKATVAPVSAGAPVIASAHHATNIGQVVAQNVTALRGQSSNPEVPHPNVVSLNLLPNASQRPSSQQSPLFRLLRVGTLSMICLTGLYLAMVCYQAFYLWQTQSALQQLHSLDATILGYRPLQADINLTSNTLEAIHTMLADHVYWTQWFTYLERYTLQSVHYTNFSGSVNGTMNLQASAPDFATVTQQIALFESLPEVTAVAVNTATRSDSGVQFNVSIQIDPVVLHYQVQDAYGN